MPGSHSKWQRLSALPSITVGDNRPSYGPRLWRLEYRRSCRIWSGVTNLNQAPQTCHAPTIAIVFRASSIVYGAPGGIDTNRVWVT